MSFVAKYSWTLSLERPSNGLVGFQMEQWTH